MYAGGGSEPKFPQGPRAVQRKFLRYSLELPGQLGRLGGGRHSLLCVTVAASAEGEGSQPEPKRCFAFHAFSTGLTCSR